MTDKSSASSVLNVSHRWLPRHKDDPKRRAQILEIADGHIGTWEQFLAESSVPETPDEAERLSRVKVLRAAADKNPC